MQAVVQKNCPAAEMKQYQVCQVLARAPGEDVGHAATTDARVVRAAVLVGTAKRKHSSRIQPPMAE